MAAVSGEATERPSAQPAPERRGAEVLALAGAVERRIQSGVVVQNIVVVPDDAVVEGSVVVRSSVVVLEVADGEDRRIRGDLERRQRFRRDYGLLRLGRDLGLGAGFSATGSGAGSGAGAGFSATGSGLGAGLRASRLRARATARAAGSGFSATAWARAWVPGRASRLRAWARAWVPGGLLGYGLRRASGFCRLSGSVRVGLLGDGLGFGLGCRVGLLGADGLSGRRRLGRPRNGLPRHRCGRGRGCRSGLVHDQCGPGCRSGLLGHRRRRGRRLGCRSRRCGDGCGRGGGLLGNRRRPGCGRRGLPGRRRLRCRAGLLLGGRLLLGRAAPAAAARFLGRCFRDVVPVLDGNAHAVAPRRIPASYRSDMPEGASLARGVGPARPVRGQGTMLAP